MYVADGDFRKEGLYVVLVFVSRVRKEKPEGVCGPGAGGTVSAEHES
jgi:hypothetical protein